MSGHFTMTDDIFEYHGLSLIMGTSFVTSLVNSALSSGSKRVVWFSSCLPPWLNSLKMWSFCNCFPSLQVFQFFLFTLNTTSDPQDLVRSLPVMLMSFSNLAFHLSIKDTYLKSVAKSLIGQSRKLTWIMYWSLSLVNQRYTWNVCPNFSLVNQRHIFEKFIEASHWSLGVLFNNMDLNSLTCYYEVK